MYVVACVAGSLTSAVVGVLMHAPRQSVGASGAICGVIAAALVLGVRTQGLRGPLTVSMAQWLGIVFLMGLLPRIDNVAHVGGAVGGGLVAITWRRGVVYGPIARWLGILGAASICVAAAAVVIVRDASDPYAALSADARYQQALTAFSEGRCDDARRALAAAAKLAPGAPQVTDLRRAIDARCTE